MASEHHDSWDDTDAGSTGHEGSAPMALSGVGVVGVWTGSLLLHLVALGLMFLVVFPFSPNRANQDIPVANAQLVGEIDATPLAPIDLPDPPAKDETRKINQEVVQTAKPQRSISDLIQPSAKKEPEISIIGIGAGGGPSAMTTALTGTDLGPDFFGLGGSARGARKIVYVVDRSASMQGAFGLVKRELRRSISALRRSQKFHVIFFAGRAPLEFAPKRCVNAIDVYKQQFFDWLDRLAWEKGGTVPGPALRRALALDPDVIYFLTDANGESFSPQLRANLDEWNKDRKTRIFTVAYLHRDAMQFLETVAREHGGECRFVSDDDLP